MQIECAKLRVKPADVLGSRSLTRHGLRAGLAATPRWRSCRRNRDGSGAIAVRQPRAPPEGRSAPSRAAARGGRRTTRTTCKDAGTARPTTSGCGETLVSRCSRRREQLRRVSYTTVLNIGPLREAKRSPSSSRGNPQTQRRSPAGARILVSTSRPAPTATST
jgi:hypothetical protein